MLKLNRKFADMILQSIGIVMFFIVVCVAIPLVKILEIISGILSKHFPDFGPWLNQRMPLAFKWYEFLGQRAAYREDPAAKSRPNPHHTQEIGDDHS
jgi:hypothetical protein